MRHGPGSSKALVEGRRAVLLASELARIVREKKPGVGIRTLTRTPRLTRSRSTIEDLHLELTDGTTTHLLWKDLGTAEPGDEARFPVGVFDPRRELWVYGAILVGGDQGPRCWAALARSTDGIYWLFLEPVEGTPLSQSLERQAWLDASGWLGEFHARFRGVDLRTPYLLRHDETLYRSWYRRAVAASESAAAGRNGGEVAELLREIAPLHRLAVERVTAGDPTLLHGDFRSNNIFVTSAIDWPRVVPIDWEMAGPGPAIMDLAALTAGDWTAGDRVEFARAYRQGRLRAGDSCPSLGGLIERLDAAHLLIAVQRMACLGDPRRFAPQQRAEWIRIAARTRRALSA